VTAFFSSYIGYVTLSIFLITVILALFRKITLPIQTILVLVTLIMFIIGAIERMIAGGMTSVLLLPNEIFGGIIVHPITALLAGLYLAGALEAVPMVGPLLGAIPAGLVALSIGPSKLIWVIVSTVIIQQLENSILVPKIMEKVSGFRPLVILLALLVGGNFFGILGAVCAVPMLMVSTIIFKKIMKY